ncbi:MAG TPA: PAS domain-containing sensor histidine kinase, partial [Anaeromyxobacter sp.]|nr:PAS domain-containing sensor histidine kinase [Anaeromyxobacter sp.]
MTLRAKLLAAQAPFALVLLVFGYVSTTTLMALGASPELILKDNYRTVLAAERMMESLEQLQAGALARAAGRPFDEGSLRDARRRVESELDVQEHNITEIGE